MADRLVQHTTLVVERRYAAAPARVFAAWSNAARKRLWFTEAGDGYSLDFRIGGQETSSGTEANGQPFRYEARLPKHTGSPRSRPPTYSWLAAATPRI